MLPHAHSIPCLIAAPALAEHPEAMSGFLLLLSALPPSAGLVADVLACPDVFQPFPVCALLQWAATGSDALAAALLAAKEEMGPNELAAAHSKLAGLAERLEATGTLATHSICACIVAVHGAALLTLCMFLAGRSVSKALESAVAAFLGAVQ
jgi:hypothetical protein